MRCFPSLIIFCIPALLHAQNEYRSGDHELLLMPTAYTMPAGQSYFSSYELFFLNYTAAITGSTHIGLFSIFPITTKFYETCTLGIKQNYFKGESFQAAAYATLTPKNTIYIVGNVVSMGRRNNGFHLSLAYAGAKGESSKAWIYMVGYRIDPSERSSLICEYTNFGNSSGSSNFNGLLTFGLRMRSTSISWEIAALRPLESTGNLLFLPLLKATYYFGP